MSERERERERKRERERESKCLLCSTLVYTWWEKRDLMKREEEGGERGNEATSMAVYKPTI